MASLGSFTTAELKHELEKRANPKYKEVLFEHIRFLEQESSKDNFIEMAVCLKRIKTSLKEHLLPYQED
jgi:hypothetical protein